MSTLGPGLKWPGVKPAWGHNLDSSRGKKSLFLSNFRLVIKGGQRLYASRHEDSEDRRNCGFGI